MIARTRPKTAVYVVLLLASLVGGGSLLIFMLFLVTGPFKLVDLGLGEFLTLLLDFVLCLVFFIQHSSMVRKAYRHRSARALPEQYSGPFYAIASGVVILMLVVFWQESAYSLLAPQGLFRWFFRVLLVLAFAGVAWTIWTLGLLTNFRLGPAVAELRNIHPQAAPLITHGPYRWVRHPLYLSSLFLIWSYPDLTMDRLLLNLLFTVWVIAGCKIEERSLLATYGDEYHNYQQKVPMLFPLRIPSSK
jgi:protein-S-isoprenylcysteine O-methyltransferase Ste14